MDIIFCTFWLSVWGLCRFLHSAALLEIWVDFDLSTHLLTTYASQLQNAVLILKDVNENKELLYESL